MNSPDRSLNATLKHNRGHDDTGLSAEESAVFRQAMGSVTTLPRKNKRKPPYTPAPSAQPKQRIADEKAVIEELLDAPPIDIETGDNLSWRRSGLQLAVLRKLRRGHYSCQGELDLHGMTVAMARHALAGFLHDARAGNWR